METDDQKPAHTATPVTGQPGSATNIRVKAFAKAILRIEQENPEAFQERLTQAIRRRRETQPRPEL